VDARGADLDSISAKKRAQFRRWELASCGAWFSFRAVYFELSVRTTGRGTQTKQLCVHWRVGLPLSGIGLVSKIRARPGRAGLSLEEHVQYISMPDQIDTDRLRLRRVEAGDAGAIFSVYAQDSDVTRFLVWMPHVSVAATLEFVTRCLSAWEACSAFPYVLVDRASGDLLGMLEMRPDRHCAEVGYVLARSHWGEGLMPEALRCVVNLAFSTLSFTRVEATCDVENTASARALEKSGFVREGRLVRHIVHPNLSAEPRDSFLYAVTKQK
jgi:ribosomal-protein-alanine N-acetyltransferase